MACLDEADAGRLGEKASWKAYVEDRFRSRFTAGDARRRAVQALLVAAADVGSRAAALAVLRAHAAIDPERPGKPRNVCNHDRDIMGNPTTASMLVEYKSSATILWFTGASYACSNLFKPVLLREGAFIPLWTAYAYDEAASGGEAGSEVGGEAYWKARREALRPVWRKPQRADDAAGDLVAAQAKIFDVVDGLKARLSAEDVSEASSRINTIVAEWDGN
jgi:hypothetical protein